MYLLILIIFGWKEIHITTDYQTHLRVKNLIENACFNTKSRRLSSRNSRGRDTVVPIVTNDTYYLYVKRNKYEEAIRIL